MRSIEEDLIRLRRERHERYLREKAQEEEEKRLAQEQAEIEQDKLVLGEYIAKMGGIEAVQRSLGYSRAATTCRQEAKVDDLGNIRHGF
jgi:hypothetical protein